MQFQSKLPRVKKHSNFYKEILSNWQEIHSNDPVNSTDFKEEILWNNRFIRICGKSFYFKSWHKNGIVKVRDLLTEQGNFLSFEHFKAKFGVRTTFLDYAGVIAAIPKAWKTAILDTPSGNQRTQNVLTADNVSAKKARSLLVGKSFRPPTVEHRLQNQNATDLEAIYELPFKITIENKLRSFQYKLIHNILPTNQRLYKMKIKASPVCELCNYVNETLEHMFCECPNVKQFWIMAIEWWNVKRFENINPKPIEILYGYKPGSSSFYALNHFFLIGKYHIYLSKIKSENPMFEVFLCLLKSKIQSEREIAIRNGNYNKHRNKWTTLCSSENT